MFDISFPFTHGLCSLARLGDNEDVFRILAPSSVAKLKRKIPYPYELECSVSIESMSSFEYTAAVWKHERFLGNPVHLRGFCSGTQPVTVWRAAMADPSLQSLCCLEYATNGNHSQQYLLLKLHEPSYHELCLASAVLGCLGSLYQLRLRYRAPFPRYQYFNVGLRGNNILFWLALTDLFAGIGELMAFNVFANFKSAVVIRLSRVKN